MLLMGEGLGNQIRTEEELQNLTKMISKLKDRMIQDQGKERNLLNDLEILEKTVQKLRTEQRNRALELENLKADRMLLGKKHYDLGQQMEDYQQELRQLVRSSFLLSRQDSIKLLLNNVNPSETSRMLSMYRFVVQSRNQQLEEMQLLRGEVEQSRAQMEKQQVKIDNELLAIQSANTELQRAEIEKQQKLSDIRTNLEDSNEEIVVYEQRRLELEELLANLKRQSNSITEQQGSSGETASISLEPELVSGGFKSNKGKLLLPISAKIKNRYGQVKPESGLFWEGLMFESPEGVVVSAIFSGQVVFSDWFRGYGQLLVIDHGDGYMSLYGHNQLLNVELGAIVQTGERIALSGSTGGLDEPGLYFEIRHDGSPDDPLKWCRN